MEWIIVLSAAALAVITGLAQNQYECMQRLLISAVILFLMCLVQEKGGEKENKKEQINYILGLLLFGELSILTLLCFYF